VKNLGGLKRESLRGAQLEDLFKGTPPKKYRLQRYAVAGGRCSQVRQGYFAFDFPAIFLGGLRLSRFWTGRNATGAWRRNRAQPGSAYT